jgi:hypothetical protein
LVLFCTDQRRLRHFYSWKCSRFIEKVMSTFLGAVPEFITHKTRGKLCTEDTVARSRFVTWTQMKTQHRLSPVDNRDTVVTCECELGCPRLWIFTKTGAIDKR